jgi:hypothetical protein
MKTMPHCTFAASLLLLQSVTVGQCLWNNRQNSLDMHIVEAKQNHNWGVLRLIPWHTLMTIWLPSCELMFSTIWLWDSLATSGAALDLVSMLEGGTMFDRFLRAVLVEASNS